MKTISNTIRLIFASALLVGLASIAQAGPGPQYWETQRTEAQFKQLKAGDKLVYVCNMCKSVSEMPADSAAHAMALCKEGATVMCPMCHKTSKVVMKGSRNEPSSHTEVTYVDEKGEECGFIAKVTDKK